MSDYTFVVDRRPQVKQRPQFGNGRTFTPKQTVEAEKHLASCYDGPVFEGLVGIDANFYPDRTVVRVFDLEADRSPLRGDVDNYLKLVLDGLQREAGAFKDDKAVHLVTARKHPKGGGLFD